MSEACHPILRYGGCTSNPAVPAGTTIVEISPGPVRAVMVTIDVIGVPELVMNDFSPSITHSPPPSSVARVRVPPASLPASGSVSPKPPSARPAHRSGSQRSCCSGVPNLWIGLAPRPTPASSVIASDWSTRASSSMATHSPVQVAAAAVRLGERDAEQPQLPHRWTVSTGNVWSRSHASACGSISASANSRTTARSASCSSVSSGCNGPPGGSVRPGQAGRRRRRERDAARRCRHAKAPT